MKSNISATWHMWAFGPSCWLFGKLIVACLTPRSNRLTWMLCLLTYYWNSPSRTTKITTWWSMATRSLITTRRAGWSLNTGIFLFSNCQWSLDLFNVWPPMGPKCPVQVEAGMILTLTGSSEFWSRPSICKDLLYLQHKTSFGRTNCFWKNHTTCCLGTGWLFLISMMKWWRSINPVMVMTTSHLLHTVWVANLVAAMAITWWSNASWLKWSKLWTLLTTRFLRCMASALQSWDWQGEAHGMNLHISWICIWVWTICRCIDNEVSIPKGNQ